MRGGVLDCVNITPRKLDSRFWVWDDLAHLSASSDSSIAAAKTEENGGGMSYCDRILGPTLLVELIILWTLKHGVRVDSA